MVGDRNITVLIMISMFDLRQSHNNCPMKRVRSLTLVTNIAVYSENRFATYARDCGKWLRLPTYV